MHPTALQTKHNFTTRSISQNVHQPSLVPRLSRFLRREPGDDDSTNLPHVHTRIVLLGSIQQLRCSVPPASVKCTRIYHLHHGGRHTQLHVLLSVPDPKSTLTRTSLVSRPTPSFPSLAVRLSGRGPGTFSHVSDVKGRKMVERL